MLESNFRGCVYCQLSDKIVIMTVLIMLLLCALKFFKDCVGSKSEVDELISNMKSTDFELKLIFQDTVGDKSIWRPFKTE